MSSPLYLALYKSRSYPDDTDKFHWARAPLPKGESLNAKIQVYQIISRPNVPCQTSHTSTNLTKLGAFVTCVYIGHVRLTPEAIKLAVTKQPTEKGDTPLLPMHQAQGRGWSCAQWIIRTLQDEFVAKDLMVLTPSDSNDFYIRVCGLGQAMRRILDDDLDDESVTVGGITREIKSPNGVPSVDI
ncbi:hypothetical protein BS47DRAFT_1096010 [Hydnum rufescens UP504]|uniref:Uncharacterized protein n=1 Tax=Hydnum rufescens UP504 TaxID=1448309 RepID=A0A9P6AVJ3_9AGAM|nr:hypothetical protein BS47DRAFT_1096010 [Hydnum rufescens UP504]